MAPTTEPEGSTRVTSTTPPTTRWGNDTTTYSLTPSMSPKEKLKQKMDLIRLKEKNRQMAKHRQTCAKNKKKRKKRR